MGATMQTIIDLSYKNIQYLCTIDENLDTAIQTVIDHYVSNEVDKIIHPTLENQLLRVVFDGKKRAGPKKIYHRGFINKDNIIHSINRFLKGKPDILVHLTHREEYTSIITTKEKSNASN